MTDQPRSSILVVDDEPLNLSIVCAYLETAGYEVLSASDGKRGLDIARRALPDLILLDVIMPGIDGFAVCRELKLSAATRDTPVIFLTALVDTESKIRGFEVGGVDYLEKPIHEEELKVRVATHLRLIRMRDQLTERNARLHESERQFRTIFNSATVGMALLERDGRISRVNDSMKAMFGHHERALCEMSALDLEHPEHGDTTRHDLEQVAARLETSLERIKRFTRKDGSTFWAEHGLSPLTDEEDRCLAIVSVITDVTEHKKAEEESRLAATVFETAAEAIIVTDADSRIVSVNRAFTRITGYEKEEVQGKSPGLLSSGRHQPAFYEQLWCNLRADGYWQGEIWNRRKNGEIYPQHLSISMVHNPEGEVTNYVAVGVDISNQKNLEEILRKQAHFDPLTHLPNRVLFQDRLRIALSRAERRDLRVAIMYIDLDGFKPINDTFGHDEGDRVLVHTATLLNECVREEDTVARLGGDEFAIILSDLELESSAYEVAERILACTSTIIERDDSRLPLSLSIGVAFYPRHGRDEEQLLKQADRAMYQAKGSGKNTWAVS